MSAGEQKNYYQILELPRSATDEQINAAYRALAIKYHPDTSHEKSDTVAAFRQVTEAYNVLSNPDKRRQYDRHICGSSPRSVSRSQINLRAAWGRSHCGLAVEDFAQAWHGVSGGLRGVENDYVQWRAVASDSPSKRIQCELPVTPEEARCGATVPLTLTIRVPCSHCAGRSDEEGRTCGACGGDRFLPRRQALRVMLPQGITNGSLLEIPCQSGVEQYSVEIKVCIRPNW
jgi:DnaJ-class molecular chaperone